MNELNTGKMYFYELNKNALLSREEISKLAVMAKKGNKAARNKIINANLRLVVKIAKSYALKYHVNLEDLISSGNIGLVIAADKFNPEYNVTFPTYAQFWIRDEIRKTLNLSHDIILPKKRAAELSKSFNTYAESLDDEAFQESRIQSEYYQNAEKITFDKMAAEGVQKFIKSLPERERQIISMHYGIGSEKHTLDEIGERLNLTKERIRQIEKNCIWNAKSKYGFKYIDGFCA